MERLGATTSKIGVFDNVGALTRSPLYFFPVLISSALLSLADKGMLMK